ncbi:MAG: DUF6056 family protein [Thermodesulfobacteriota bacterium]
MTEAVPGSFARSTNGKEGIKSGSLSFSVWLKIVLIVFLSPFVGLAFFAHPSHDDYCYTNAVVKMGLWGTSVDYFYELTGRYFSVLASALFGLAGDLISTYPLFVLFLIGTSFLAIYCLTSSLLRGTLHRSEVFWIALAAFCMYLSAIPYPSQAFYWLTGGLHYQFAASVLVLFAAALASEWKSESRFTYSVRLVVCCLLAVAVVGTNETDLFLALGMTTAGAVLTFKSDRPAFWVWLAALATALAFSVPAILAPGNYVRALDLPVTHPHFELLRAVYQSIKYGCYFFLRFLVRSPSLIVLSVVLVPIALHASQRMDFLQRITTRHLLIGAALWLGMLMLSFFPRCFVLGHVGPPRTINTSYLVFLAGWFMNLFLSVAWLRRRYGPTFQISPRVLTASRIAFVAVVLTLGNFFPAARELIFYAPTYRAEMLQRYELIRESVKQGKLDVEVPPVSPGPVFLAAADDLRADSSYWYNTCMAEYFRAQSLKASKPR